MQCYFQYKEEGELKTRIETVGLSNFMKQKVQLSVLPYDHEELNENKAITETFDGVYIDTFFSGYAVKIAGSGDGAIIAYFYS